MSRLPALFIGHGSPMNALADNGFTRALADLRETVKEPKGVLVISAHWMTEGTWVTHMEHPRTIHDFFGFPPELFAVRYPAPGSPALAGLVKATVRKPQIQLDDEMWGLDHGTWSVLRHLYPQANVPVMQLSLNLAQPAAYHLDLGRQLRALRDQGILIVGSGNVVHNLRKLRWEENAEPFGWAAEFDGWVKTKLESRDIEALSNDFGDTEAGRLSVPTTEHYWPLLYVLGAAEETDSLHWVFEGIQNSSISMRTFYFGS